MDFAADLPLFFVDFGRPALVGGVAVRGIFENAYADALGMGGTRPALLVAASVNAQRGTSVVIDGQPRYEVAVRQPDGEGMMWLMLEQVE